MNLAQRIDEFLGHEELAGALADALSLRNSSAETEFDALIARVEGGFESSATFGILRRFLHDHSRITDAELLVLLEFIYSSLVNNFKGELAETLAVPLLQDFATVVADAYGFAHVEVVYGPELSAPLVGRSVASFKTADALFVTATDPLEIVAAAEIKSMWKSIPPMLRQAEKHIDRFASGLMLRGRQYGPADVFLRTENRHVAVATRDPAVPSRLPMLLVRPWRRAESLRATTHPTRADVWLAELPYSADVLTEAAYRFAAWYFGRIGPKVFVPAGAPPSADRIPVPHAGDSLEENGVNSLIEALYWAGQRDVIVFPGTAARGKRPLGETHLRLYNALTGGSGEVRLDEPVFGTVDADPVREARARRRADARAAYHAGAFREALALFPDPADCPEQWARLREWLMLARLHARSGDGDGAAAALAHEHAERQIANAALPLEVAAVTALVDLARGDAAAAAASRSRATDLLHDLRTRVAEHEARGFGFPADIDIPSAQAAVLDLAVIAAQAGDRVAAVALLERLHVTLAFSVDDIVRDPALSFLTPETVRALRDAMPRSTGLQRF